MVLYKAILSRDVCPWCSIMQMLLLPGNLVHRLQPAPQECGGAQGLGAPARELQLYYSLHLGAVVAISHFESAKTDPVRFKWGFGEGLLKDNFPFFEAYKSPIPKRRKLLAKRPFL